MLEYIIHIKLRKLRKSGDKEYNLGQEEKAEQPKTWRGERLLYAKDVENIKVQDEVELVVVGADVEVLFLSLTDPEVAQICYDAVMN